MTDNLPERSSGALWSPDEDQRLYDAVRSLTATFPGRSLAAVVTRIALIIVHENKRHHRHSSTQSSGATDE